MRWRDKHTDVTYRDNGEDGVDESGSNSGINRLFHTCWIKDACWVVEYLRDTQGKKIHILELLYILSDLLDWNLELL